MRRAWTLARELPADLITRLSSMSTRCEQAWRGLRAANDWLGVQPLLEELLILIREKAQRLAEQKALSPYDALLDEYEPGLTSASVTGWFGELKTFLPGMVDAALARQNQLDQKRPRGPFAAEQQRTLGLELMTALGFDFARGRLDLSHHPFCGGVPDDVRITTRFNEQNFLEGLMGVLHETGHALYEQGLPQEWRNQPVGNALGMAVHESQSLLVEMQACRSREFLTFAAPLMREAFGADRKDPAWSAEHLHRLSTRVERGLIRVDADELTYPLHVILRFELEKLLLENTLAISELPDAWDTGMRTLLGRPTGNNYRDGVMQDVHWYAGLVGYFPTYTVGAMTAAQLFQGARDAIGDLPEQIARGNFRPLLNWLRQNVHGQGRLHSAQTLVAEATGSPLDPGIFRRHLENRYLG
jgi:carboxypeptidase Taq